MKHLFAAVLIMLTPLPAVSSDFSDAFQAELDAGRTASAMEVARDALAAESGNREAQFALGVAQFLSAAEVLGQGLHRFGLKNEFSNDALSLGGLPFLRLPVPPNPEPEQVTYEGLREVLAGFVNDLAVAEAALAKVAEGPILLPLDLGTARIDLDGDGQGSAQETLADIFDALNGRMTVEKRNLGFSFDESDVPWLRGYCHLLMAVAEIPLAHDWERAFDTTFHGLFPDTEMPNSLLGEETQRMTDALKAYRDRPGGPPGTERPSRPNKPTGTSWSEWRRSAEYAEYEKAMDAWYKTQDYRDLRDMDRLENALWGASIADLISFIHLFDWPVVEPERAASARLHLLSMIELSRENWRLVNAETDDNNEWLPNPQQTLRFTNLRVNSDVISGWHGFLDEFEAVLKGEKLIRHWRFPGDRGVNIRRMFEEPGRLDPMMIATGPGVLPYLEDGEAIDGDRVGTVLQMVGGGFFAYFVWFN